MSKTQFEGTFLVADFAILVDFVTDWLGWPKSKIRTIGEELVYSDDATHLYCQTAMWNPGPLTSFLAEGSFKGDNRKTLERIEQMKTACVRNGVGCDLVFTSLDDNGEPVGEEIEIIVPTA